MAHGVPLPVEASTVAAIAVRKIWDVVSDAVQVSSKSITSILMEGAELTPGCALKKSTSICIAVLYSCRRVPADSLGSAGAVTDDLKL